MTGWTLGQSLGRLGKNLRALGRRLALVSPGMFSGQRRPRRCLTPVRTSGQGPFLICQMPAIGVSVPRSLIRVPRHQSTAIKHGRTPPGLRLADLSSRCAAGNLRRGSRFIKGSSSPVRDDLPRNPRLSAVTRRVSPLNSVKRSCRRVAANYGQPVGCGRSEATENSKKQPPTHASQAQFSASGCTFSIRRWLSR
jgi:hypothetical protein